MPTVKEVESRLSGPRRRLYQYLRAEALALYVPTMREIGSTLDLPLSSVHYHMRCLSKIGLLRRQERGRHSRYIVVGSKVVFDENAEVEVGDAANDPSVAC
jgi:DNA-binding transcriptional ArsR family regulator